jgi:phosphohistidine phosphatase
MELILWRHAEAEDGVPDDARRLTPKGEKQARKIAHWLETRLQDPVIVLASPAVRAQETARALGVDMHTVAELAPGASARDVLRVAGWPKADGTVIVVGHQPTLGQTAALLLSGDVADWNFKKGAIWWFQSQRGTGAAHAWLRAVLSPAQA